MIREPSATTLARYGLSLEEWLAYIPDGVCPICENNPPSGRFVVDHEHVVKWKDKPPEERKLYVRGVVCTTDNHFCLTRYMTSLKAKNIAVYLEEYAKRRPR